MQQLFALHHPSENYRLVLTEAPLPTLGEHDILIKHQALGVNYLDYEYCLGKKPIPGKHITPGVEAVGTVAKLGEKVTKFKLGQRVAYATTSHGGYAEYNSVLARQVLPVPDSLSAEAIALNLRKGMTAHYLLRRTFFVRPEMTILIHAATSNVGMLMIKLAQHYGVNVIATTSTNQKKQLLLDLGVKAAFNYNNENFVTQVKDITAGIGVNVVYDFLGGNILEMSKDCLMNFGLLVSAGMMADTRPPMNLDLLSGKSLFVTCPNLATYKHEREELMMSAMEVYALITNRVFDSTAKIKYNFTNADSAIEAIKEREFGSKVIIL